MISAVSRTLDLGTSRRKSEREKTDVWPAIMPPIQSASSPSCICWETLKAHGLVPDTVMSILDHIDNHIDSHFTAGPGMINVNAWAPLRVHRGDIQTLTSAPGRKPATLNSAPGN